MANEITLFNSGVSAPALANYVSPLANIQLPVGGGAPSIRIKNGRFIESRDGEETVIDSMVINIVVVGIASMDHRSWYKDAYDPKQKEVVGPTCWSADGINPDARSSAPQSASCATCQWDAFGSSRKPGSEGKDCGTHRRIAMVVEGDEEGDIYTLNLPATSITPFGKYVTALLRKDVGVERVVTQIGFDPSAVGKLQFDAVSWVAPEVFLAHVAPRIMDAEVTDALMVSYSNTAKAPAQVAAPAAVPAPKGLQPAAVTPAPAAAPVAEAPQVETDVPLPATETRAKGFGKKTAAAPAPTAPAAPAPAEARVVSDIANLEAEFDALISGKAAA